MNQLNKVLEEMLSGFSGLRILVNTLAKISFLAKISASCKLICLQAKNKLNHI